MNSHRALMLLVALLGTAVAMALPAPTAQAVNPMIRVEEGGAASGTCGLDWDNPCDLHYALTTVAVSGNEIWVAEGTYKPTSGTDRSATFQLKNGVALYGGFGGGETERTQRDVAAHVTTLSGDLGVPFDPTDNAYHVVTSGSGITATTVLDGFTVTGGNANVPPNDSAGGGMYTDSGSPKLVNVTFTTNTATSEGGGMYAYSGSPTLTNVIFSENTATSEGGGMSNVYGSPTLTNVTFSGNTAGWGGGMANFSNSLVTLTDVTFSGNTATSEGGGMYTDGGSLMTLTGVTFDSNKAGEGGGMYTTDGSPTLTNVTFTANEATEHDGGGMFNTRSNPELVNVTFRNNAAINGGDGMYNSESGPVVRNSILWGNTAPASPQVLNEGSTLTIAHSVVQGGCPDLSTSCTGLIIADPHLGALGDWGGATQTIPLLPGSSAIDAGDAAFCPETDQRGVARPQGAGCDLGAFEVPYLYLPWVIRQ